MKYLYRFKYKIYRRFQSDIWGEIILAKKFNNLYKFILDNFEFNLRRFYYKYLLNYLKHLRVLRNKKFKSTFFFKKFREDLALIKKTSSKTKPDVKVKTEYLSLLTNNFKKDKSNLYLLKYSYSLFWLNFLQIYALINSLFLNQSKYNKYFLFNNFQNKNKFQFKTIMFLTYLIKRLVGKNRKWIAFKRFPSKVKKFFHKKDRFNRFNIFDHLKSDYMLPPRKIYFKKRRSTWWNLKIEQDRSNVFFGFFTRKKFLKFQQNCFYSNKIRTHWILTLVGRISFLLFQMNFYNNMYYAYNFIKSGNVLVNKQIKLNPSHVVSLFDNISFNKKEFKKMYLLIRFKFLNNKIMLNTPKYLEINYSTLTASIWRMPKSSDIIGPYDFPFKTFSHDWLIYKNYH